jgi:predicted membrane-bound spermidine synthase
VVGAALAGFITYRYHLDTVYVTFAVEGNQHTIPAFVAMMTGFCLLATVALLILQLMLNEWARRRFLGK